VVDVEHDLHARRVDALDDVETPGEVIEDLVGPLVLGHLGVRDLHAERDALLLGIALDAVEEGDGVVRAFVPRHAAPLARHADEHRAADAGAGVDALARALLERVVHLLADQSVLKARAHAGHHARRQPVLLELHGLFRRGQIHRLVAEPRQRLAALLEGEGRVLAPDRRHHALPDLRARTARRRCLCSGRGCL
jgi:hypothetical protein